MKFYRVSPATHAVLEEHHGQGGLKIGVEWVPAVRLAAQYSIFPYVLPDYDPTAEVLSEPYFDATQQVVTARVHAFAAGLRHKWKATRFVQNAQGEWVIDRGIRVTVLYEDCETGGPLAERAFQAIKNMSPFLRVNDARVRDDFGSRYEMYLAFILPADLALLEGYFALRGAQTGIEYFENLD